MFVYRFISVTGQIIYVGRTNNLKRRLTREHFTERGHLGEECYREAEKVEYAKVTSENESKIYEMYLIEKYQPKYNEQGVSGGDITFQMPSLIWKKYPINKNNESLGVTKESLLRRIKEFGDNLENEVGYMENYLRNKDRVSWLNKLTEEEKNEYVGMVYHMERYVRGIEELKDELVKDELVKEEY